ncbi:hypothetical protein IID20_01865 [Patescibacteria group bacterium]|nr:hypothetical protein [Patescibacteria group bacterium]
MSEQLFKEIEPTQEADLEVLAKSRSDVAKIIKENPEVFGFVVKKEKEKDLKSGEEKEVERKYIRILGIELEMNEGDEGTQFSPEDFKGFSLDKKSLELMKIMAVGIKLNQPLLIEGPTDIGKSKSLEFLAYLTNNYLLYQSFSGQTDVTELIGKYVPAVEDVRIRFENLLRNKKTLKPETLEIVQKLEADSDRATLTIEECKQIALTESLVAPEELEKLQWSWSDGTVPRAMKHDNGRGCWLYFDELGAAEPQILVKINRIFGGNFARLTITENSQNPEIEAVYPEWHPQKGKPNRYRLIATTNPPSYAGREPFEKDFLRRWVYQRVTRLDKNDFLTRLDFVGHAQKPELPDLVQHPPLKGIDLEKFPELDHLFNLVITEFRNQAQAKLDAGEWERGEQEFRFDELSDALRAQKYLRELQGPDLVENLKQAIRFYYLGKIETSLPFYYSVDWKESTKTSKEKGTKKLTKKDIEYMQTERAKDLEAILIEILQGSSGQKIESKSISDKIKEVVESLNQEIKKELLIAELKNLKRGIWTIPEKEKAWGEAQADIKEYEEALKTAQDLEKGGKAEKDIGKAAVALKEAVGKYKEIESIEQKIKQKIGKREDLFKQFRGPT